MDDTVFEIKPHLIKPEKKQPPYRWRSCFASEDEYAQYLSDIITAGMTVRCCKAFEGVSNQAHINCDVGFSANL